MEASAQTFSRGVFYKSNSIQVNDYILIRMIIQSNKDVVCCFCLFIIIFIIIYNIFKKNIF